jgi:hypothetical protein
LCAAGDRAKWRISFAHYPWNEAEDGHQFEPDWRLHGHIHNSGYSRDTFVPFLRNHINLSVEQTKYRPVNLGRLLEAVLLGKYPERPTSSLRKRARVRRPTVPEITSQRLKELLEAERQLLALKDAGVDNWEGYDIALKALYHESEPA